MESRPIFALRDRAAVARRAHNPKVGGSNPPLATYRKPRLGRAFIFY